MVFARQHGSAMAATEARLRRMKRPVGERALEVKDAISTATPTTSRGALRVRSDSPEAAALHHQAEVLDRPLDLLVRVLEQLGHQLAGLAPGRVVPQ